MPEVFAKDKSTISDNLILTLKKVIKNKTFEKLSDKDKRS